MEIEAKTRRIQPGRDQGPELQLHRRHRRRHRRHPRRAKPRHRHAAARPEPSSNPDGTRHTLIQQNQSGNGSVVLSGPLGPNVPELQPSPTTRRTSCRSAPSSIIPASR
ncbi:MAG: hypothetical protein WDO13_07735 [Verrucomicrobiota bacterium]